MIILKNYEEHILGLKFEDLLQFLINDIVRGGFFNDTNYQNFINISESFNIKTGLMSNLENEFSQEEKIREIDRNLGSSSSSDKGDQDRDNWEKIEKMEKDDKKSERKKSV